MTYRKLLGGVVVLVILFAGCGLFHDKKRGKAIESWETTNEGLKIRVTQYEEKNSIFFTQFYYVFESAVAGSGDWREITTVRTDDDVAIPHEQVRFVSDRICYLFMEQAYAVTEDNGRTWSVWNAGKEYNNSAFIKDIQIRIDGSGAMKFHPIPSQQIELPELYTKDYGKHWEMKN